jgi:hypothetical protein
MLMNIPIGSRSKQESEKSEDVVLARRRGLLEQLQEDRPRIASCVVDSPLVPDVLVEFRPSIISDVHIWRDQAPDQVGDVGGRTKGVLDPRPWDRINR